MQKYSRGRRGAPAKGVGWATGARVQIPPSALRFLKLQKTKKSLTKEKRYGSIPECRHTAAKRQEPEAKMRKGKVKKQLTGTSRCAKITTAAEKEGNRKRSGEHNKNQIKS